MHNISTGISVISSKIFNISLHFAINSHQFDSIYRESIIFIQFIENLREDRNFLLYFWRKNFIKFITFFFFLKKISLLNYIRIIPIIQIMCNNFPISSSGLATNEFSEWFHAHSTTNWTEFTGGGFQQPWSDKHPFCWFKTEFFVALMLAFFSQILSHIVKTVEFIKALQFSPAFSLSSSSPDC